MTVVLAGFPLSDDDLEELASLARSWAEDGLGESCNRDFIEKHRAKYYALANQVDKAANFIRYGEDEEEQPVTDKPATGRFVQIPDEEA